MKQYSDGFALINGQTAIDFNEYTKAPYHRLKKRQGMRVKKYRKALVRAGIKFTESMFINTCMCDMGFTRMCEPGQMTVVFTWE